MIAPLLALTGSAPSDHRSAPPTRPRRHPAVVAAVDVAEPGRSRDVLEMAAALADLRGSGEATPALHVVYGWSLVGESILTCPIRGVSPRRLRGLLSRIGGQHRERLTDLCDEVLPRRPDGIHVHRGDPRNVVPAAVRRLRADLLVIGGAVGTGFGRILLGSVARAVVDQVTCDVVTVRGRYRW